MEKVYNISGNVKRGILKEKIKAFETLYGKCVVFIKGENMYSELRRAFLDPGEYEVIKIQNKYLTLKKGVKIYYNVVVIDEKCEYIISTPCTTVKDC